MGEKIAGFFSNDSPFGQFMIRVGILIVSSILFAVTTVPIVTIGPGLAALYTVMLNSRAGFSRLCGYQVLPRTGRVLCIFRMGGDPGRALYRGGSGLFLPGSGGF